METSNGQVELLDLALHSTLDLDLELALESRFNPRLNPRLNSKKLIRLLWPFHAAYLVDLPHIVRRLNSIRAMQQFDDPSRTQYGGGLVRWFSSRKQPSLSKFNAPFYYANVFQVKLPSFDSTGSASGSQFLSKFDRLVIFFL